MRLPPPIDQEDFYAQLLQASRTEPERAIVVLLWRTGMHASTLVSKRWGGERSEHSIHWRRTKTNKLLIAHLTDTEYKLCWRVRRAGFLPNTVRTLQRWVRRIGERAGYAEVCPLTLRHSRAIYLLDSGRPVNRVAALLGCSWEVLERHYAVIEDAREVSK